VKISLTFQSITHKMFHMDSDPFWREVIIKYSRRTTLMEIWWWEFDLAILVFFELRLYGIADF